MKRRDFLKTSTAAAIALAGSQQVLQASTVGEGTPTVGAIPGQNMANAPVGSTPESNFPPKPPLFAASRLSPDIKLSPMTFKKRLRRGIVPRRGFCSTLPGTTVSEGLTCGNGHMNIEVACDPYSEQILFHHESLLVPWKRPLEAPKAAEVFPQVRQMVLDGKYQDAIELAFKEMNKGPIKQNTGPHPVLPAFLMRLDLPKTASVTNYLRTVNFDSSEVKVHWSDEHGVVGSSGLHLAARRCCGPIADRPAGATGECQNRSAEILAGKASGRIVRRKYGGERSSHGLQRRAAYLQVPPGSLGR